MPRDLLLRRPNGFIDSLHNLNEIWPYYREFFLKVLQVYYSWMCTVRFTAISGLICCLGGWLIGYLVSEFVMGCKHVGERREEGS